MPAFCTSWPLVFIAVTTTQRPTLSCALKAAGILRGVLRARSIGVDFVPSRACIRAVACVCSHWLERFPRGFVFVRGIDGEQPASMGRKWVGLAGDRPRCSCGEFCCACFAVLALLCLSRALDPWCCSSWLRVSLRSGCLAYPVPGGPSP